MADTEETPKEWFKKLWVAGKDEDDIDEEDFEVIFAKYTDKWFADFKKYFNEVGLLENSFQHPKHILPSE